MLFMLVILISLIKMQVIWRLIMVAYVLVLGASAYLLFTLTLYIWRTI